MTRLAVMSDLHIDLNHFETYEIDTLIKCLKDQEVSHLHIAGDISNHFSIDTKPFLRKLSKAVKVTYNLGNHDMLDLEDELIDNLDFQEVRPYWLFMGGMIIPILMKNWIRFLNVRSNSGSTDDLNDWVLIPKSVKLVSRS